MSLSSKVTTIKTVKQMDELVDTGTDTPVWQRYRLKIMSLTQQVSEAERAKCCYGWKKCNSHTVYLEIGCCGGSSEPKLHKKHGLEHPWDRIWTLYLFKNACFTAPEFEAEAFTAWGVPLNVPRDTGIDGNKQCRWRRRWRQVQE